MNDIRSKEESMKISKSTDKQVRALALKFASDLDNYSETLTQKALSPTTDAQDLLDEFYGALNKLAGDILPTFEKWLDVAVKENEICA